MASNSKRKIEIEETKYNELKRTIHQLQDNLSNLYRMNQELVHSSNHLISATYSLLKPLKFDFFAEMPNETLFHILDLLDIDDYLFFLITPWSKRLYNSTLCLRLKLKEDYLLAQNALKFNRRLVLSDRSRCNLLMVRIKLLNSFAPENNNVHHSILGNFSFGERFFQRLDKKLLKVSEENRNFKDKLFFNYPLYGYRDRFSFEMDSLTSRILLCSKTDAEEQKLEFAEKELYAVMIVACKYNRVNILHRFISSSPFDSNLLLGAVEYGNHEIVEILLKDFRVNPSDNSNQAIKVASKYGYFKIVKRLMIDTRVNIAVESNLPLRLAAKNGHYEVLELFLNNSKTDPSAEQNEAIRLASEYGHYEIVDLLLKHPKVYPAAENDYAIRRAAINGHLEVVKLLIEDSRADPGAVENEALIKAYDNCHSDVVQHLLRYSSKVNPFGNSDHLIHGACIKGDLVIVDLLLRDPKFDASKYSIWTALNSACHKGHLDIVKLFLKDSRILQNSSFDYEALLYEACYSGKLELIKFLLGNRLVYPKYCIGIVSEKGLLEAVKIFLADPTVDPSYDKNYSIRKASKNGHLEIVKILLDDSRVDPSALDNEAIRSASLNGHFQVVELLLKDERADPSSKNNITIRTAARNGDSLTFGLLIEDPRVDPSSENNEAIQTASEHGYFEIVKRLLEDPRVDPSANDNYAIRFATRNNHLKIVKLLSADSRVDASFAKSLLA